MYLNLKSDPVSSFPNPHSISKVQICVSTAHICRLNCYNQSIQPKDER